MDILTQVATVVADGGSSSESSSSGVTASSSTGRAYLQWGGTLSAIFLLILNRTGRRSPTQTTLLVLYLITSSPTVLFKILREQFGRWVAFLAIAANLFFPQTFPFSRFILFVITPDWLADGVRDSIAGGFIGLLIGVLLIIRIETEGTPEDSGESECNCHRFAYRVGIALLFFFTILYLCW